MNHNYVQDEGISVVWDGDSPLRLLIEKAEKRDKAETERRLFLGIPTPELELED